MADGEEIQIRHLIAGILSTAIKTDDQQGIWTAASMIDAMVHNALLAAARHAGEAGCARCLELAREFAAAKNTSDEGAFDAVANELYSHLSLESDLAGDTGWLDP